MELILPKQLTPYMGAQPQAVWTAVYALAKSKYVDRSADFTPFYVNEIVPRLKQTPTPVSDIRAKDDEDVSKIELAKIERVINLDPVAGLELALGWCKDPKSIRRIFAASILGDINDQLAAEALQKLTSDLNADVVANAQFVISLKKKRMK